MVGFRIDVNPLRLCLAALLILLLAVRAGAQIRGVVIDDERGEGIAYPNVSYEGHPLGVSGDALGVYSIERHEGLKLTFSAVGFKSKTIVIKSKTPAILDVRLKPDTKQLSEVVVRSKRSRYSRRDNPAVELMKRVIAAKRRSQLKQHDYLQYTRYQRLTTALNDVKPARIDSGLPIKNEWLREQIEHCPYNDKLILPLTVDETLSQHLYRREPAAEKEIILGERSEGINRLFQTGDLFSEVLKDVFTDVDIYDDQVRLLQKRFTSPIGKDAIGFYRYYIRDTVYLDNALCYHLQYLPNNLQDFGFRGELYVLADSSLQVKRCTMTVPETGGVNFVESLHVEQEYRQTSDGSWALSTDDMVAELRLNDLIPKAIVIKKTRLEDYRFDPPPPDSWKGKDKERDQAAKTRGEAFWTEHRPVELSKGEASMGTFVRNLQRSSGFNYLIFAAKALMESYVETGSAEHPSKVDIGPVNTMISRNFIDGWRTRIGAQTTAHLNKHWFLSGYYARGWHSQKNYYKGELTYSFNKKEYLPHEFPKRTLTFTTTYDIGAPSDRFSRTDKDNLFAAFKWTTVDKMLFYRRHQLLFEYDQEWGLRTSMGLKVEENEAAGSLFFNKLNSGVHFSFPSGTVMGDQLHNGKLRTTELSLRFELSPGRSYIHTKQRSMAFNREATVYALGHTFGLKGVMGGEYRYNLTEASLFKRFWLNSWGQLDVYLRGAVQWNKVPYPLLVMPPSQQSYFAGDGTFGLMNEMEFLSDRYVSLHLGWDLNGKLFNRLPLLKKLKWREYIGVRTLWGALSSRNNANLANHAGDAILMQFPEGSYALDAGRPYVEWVVGVHNILKLLHVEYVYRGSYNELPTSRRHGLRFKLRMTF